MSKFSDRVIEIIENLPPEKRGYALRHGRAYSNVSLSDLLTDLEAHVREALAQETVSERDQRQATVTALATTAFGQAEVRERNKAKNAAGLLLVEAEKS